jgi:hypothetical protein
MRGDLFLMGDFPLLVAGEAGQASLARSADSHGLRACVDQHVAEVRDALNGRITEGVLLSYARGFVEAAVARGWWPPHRQASPSDSPAIERVQGPGGSGGPAAGEPGWHPDWESLRLAAICHLFLETQGLVPAV